MVVVLVKQVVAVTKVLVLALGTQDVLRLRVAKCSTLGEYQNVVLQTQISKLSITL
jgi:hypothetical protein